MYVLHEHYAQSNNLTLINYFIHFLVNFEKDNSISKAFWKSNSSVALSSNYGRRQQLAVCN